MLFFRSVFQKINILSSSYFSNPIIRPWKYAILTSLIIALIWFLQKEYVTNESLNFLDWVTVEQILMVSTIFITIQIPFLIFGMKSIIDAGYVKKEIFDQVLPFRTTILSSFISIILIFASFENREADAIFPLLVLVFMTSAIIFLTTSVAIQKRHFYFSKYISNLATNLSKKICKYHLKRKKKHDALLKYIVKSKIIALTDADALRLRNGNKCISIDKDRFLYDINLKKLKKIINNVNSLETYETSEYFKESELLKTSLPSNWTVNTNKQPKLLINYNLFTSFPFSDMSINKLNILCASYKFNSKFKDIGKIDNFKNQIEKIFHFDNKKNHLQANFNNFDNILEEIEEGLKTHLGDSNTSIYEELLEFLIIIIRSMDQVQAKELEKCNYIQVYNNYYSQNIYYKSIHFKLTQIFKYQLEMAVNKDLFNYFMILIKQLSRMIGAVSIYYDEIKMPLSKTTIFRWLHILPYIMQHAIVDYFEKPKFNPIYFNFAVMNFRVIVPIRILKFSASKKDNESDFFFKVFFEHSIVQIFLLVMTHRKQEEFEEHHLVNLDTKRSITFWQDVNFYESPEENNFLFQVRCYIYTLICCSEYSDFKLFSIKDLEFSNQQQIPYRITEIAIECYTNEKYRDLLDSIILQIFLKKGSQYGDVSSSSLIDKTIKEIWMELILNQERVSENIADYMDYEKLSDKEKEFFTNNYPSIFDENKQASMLSDLSTRLLYLQDDIKIQNLKQMIESLINKIDEKN